jgi:hypothetical protein
MPAMRPWLRWTLVSTLAMTAAALLWPDNTVHAVGAAVQRSTQAPLMPQAPATVAYAGDAPIGPLPAELPHHHFDKAIFDPFVGVQPPAPPAPPTPKAFVGPIYEPPPPPPAINYRYLGQMTSPTGEHFVYLSRGKDDIPVAVGTHLDEGYVVESIAADGVHLYYPPLKARTVIPMSAPAQDASQIARISTP